MEQGPLRRREVVVHRLANQRVHEPQVPFLGHDLAPAQGVERGGDLFLRVLGQLRHRRQTGRLTEDGDGPRCGGDDVRHPAKPQRHDRRHGPRAHRAHRVDVRHVRRDSLVLERAQQLPQQQRVARRHAVAGAHEGLRALTETLPHECPGRLGREWRRPQPRHRGVEGDLQQQRVVGLVLPGTPRQDDQDRQPLEPLDQVGQEAERRAVTPLDVVDADQQRLLGGQVHGQPVQPVEHREAAVLTGPGPQCFLEDGGRARGSPGEQRVAAPGVAETGLEQLPDRPEAEGLLQLAASRRQHPDAAGPGEPGALDEQARLADPRRPLDEDAPRRPGSQVVHHPPQDGRLAVPVDEVGRNDSIRCAFGCSYRSRGSRAVELR